MLGLGHMCGLAKTKTGDALPVSLRLISGITGNQGPLLMSVDKGSWSVMCRRSLKQQRQHEVHICPSRRPRAIRKEKGTPQKVHKRHLSVKTVKLGAGRRKSSPSLPWRK